MVLNPRNCQRKQLATGWFSCVADRHLDLTQQPLYEFGGLEVKPSITTVEWIRHTLSKTARDADQSALPMGPEPFPQRHHRPAWRIGEQGRIPEVANTNELKFVLMNKFATGFGLPRLDAR